MTRFLRSRRLQFGATLAEGIVALCISGMFLSLLPGFYATGVRVWQRESGRLATSGRADLALERMKEDVRSARRAEVSSDGRILLLIMPLRAYDPALGCEANVIDEQGMVQDGDSVQYLLLNDSPSVGSGSTLHRRVVAPDGTVRRSTVVASHVHPELNPLDSSTGTAHAVFDYNEASRLLTVNVAAAEPEASRGTFGPTEAQVKCSRDGGSLVRVATQEHPDGEVHCSICQGEVSSNAQIAAYQTQLLLRNG